MRPERRRNFAIIAGSVAVHATVLAVVALQSPKLEQPEEDAGPPQAIIPLLLMPRAPPPAPGSSAPTAIRLHRRAPRTPDAALPVAPLPVPKSAVIAEEPTPPKPTAAAPAPPPTLPAPVRNALRLGPLGCANAGFLGLTKEEREACDERLAAGGGKDLPYLAPGRTAAARGALASEAARKDALVRRKEAPLAGGLQHASPEPADYDGEPYVTGAGSSAVGQAEYSPSKRAAKKLGPLKP